MVVGKNYRFGYKARGDANLLQKLGQQHGISIAITELLGAGVPGRVGEVRMLSSRFRAVLQLDDTGLLCLDAHVHGVQP